MSRMNRNLCSFSTRVHPIFGCRRYVVNLNHVVCTLPQYEVFFSRSMTTLLKYKSKILIHLENQKKYDSSASADYVPDGRYFEANYGSGSVSGIFSNDTIRVSYLSVKRRILVDNFEFRLDC